MTRTSEALRLLTEELAARELEQMQIGEEIVAIDACLRALRSGESREATESAEKKSDEPDATG